jgi:hypothetical protein
VGRNSAVVFRVLLPNFVDPIGGFSMVPVISVHSLLVWFVWGLFMALGWVLGAVVMEWLLGFLGKRRNRLYDFLGSLRDPH